MAITKLEQILIERSMSQGELRRIIKKRTGFMMGRDRISKICTGRLVNYTVMTAVMISEALEVSINDIVDMNNIKKENLK